MTESVAYPGGSARRQSIGEEVLNAISHGIGAVMAVIGTVLLVLRAKEEGDLLNIISVAIFGGSMILLILGTYTPICLITVGGTFGLTIFGINLACGIVGIVLNAVSLKRWKKVSLVLYIVMGWLGILALPTIWRNMTLEGLCLLLLGGVAYTVGVIFYRQKEKPYRHGIWHFFVLAGTVLQFFAVYTNCCAG